MEVAGRIADYLKGSSSEVITIIISMLPIAELRGAIVGRQCSLKSNAVVFEGVVIGDNEIQATAGLLDLFDGTDATIDGDHQAHATLVQPAQGVEIGSDGGDDGRSRSGCHGRLHRPGGACAARAALATAAANGQPKLCWTVRSRGGSACAGETRQRLA